MVDGSVIVATYNHENYIKKAIQGVLMQNFTFEMEVIIADDASTDNTGIILAEMKSSLPNNYKVICREKNIGAAANFEDLVERAQGRYLIILEGDDYWTDPNKLQTQYDFLENNPDYLAIAHNCTVVDENGKYIDYQYPECKKEDYTFDDFINGILPGQTTTKMIRNYFKFDILIDRNLDVGSYPGDRKEAFLLTVNGKVYCMQKTMSAYRLVRTSGSSYSANYKYNIEVTIYYWLNLFKYCIRNHLSKHISSEVGARYFFYLTRSKSKVSFVSKSENKYLFKKMPYKYKIVSLYACRAFRYITRRISREKGLRNYD